MSQLSVAEQIKSMIEGNWALTGELRAHRVEFSVGWFNAKVPDKHQVTVRHLYAGPITYFGATEENLHLNMLGHSRYVVNCWVIVRRGESGDEDEDLIDAMRREVVQILNLNRTCFVPPIGLVIPLDFGRALHEWDRVPRILRYEITLMVNYNSA